MIKGKQTFILEKGDYEALSDLLNSVNDNLISDDSLVSMFSDYRVWPVLKSFDLVRDGHSHIAAVVMFDNDHKWIESRLMDDNDIVWVKKKELRDKIEKSSIFYMLEQSHKNDLLTN